MKIVKYLVYTVVLFMLLAFKVDAASVSISSSAGTVVVGNNFTINVTVSSDVEAWDFSIGYDTSKLRLVSSGLETGMRSASLASIHSRSYSITFKALSSGTASIYVSDALLYDKNDTVLSASRGSRTFTLRTQAEIEASYSKNNYLSGLSVDGVTLSPEFNKDTLEYSLELVPETSKININASVEDANSSVEGAGEREVTEGENRLEIKVTAQNGTTRTYVVNATVKEYNPIKVKIDSKEYTVVRKKALLTPPNHYEETTLKISGEDIPAYKGLITKYVIVYLKDESGKTNWYICDNDKYIKYNEYKFGQTILYPLELDSIPTGYKKTTIDYNGEKIVAYKLSKNSKYALIYAQNVETGDKNIYMYDSNEGTVQIYNDEQIKLLSSQNDIYLKILIGLTIGLTISIVFALKKKSSN